MMAPANPAVAAHPPHFIMPGTGDGQERRAVGARRRLVEARRQLLAEGLVGTLGVVAIAKPIEPALLGRQRASRRPGRLGLERLVHPLVASVLLGVGRLDQFGLDPESDA